MKTFNIDTFAHDLKLAMSGAESRRAAAADFLKAAIAEHGTETIRMALQEAVPPDADVGELIVHQSSELTILFARIPAHFQSAIHDHTVCAIIGQLVGEERSVVYEPAREGEGLLIKEEISVTPGEVMVLPKDAIHHIENPCSETSCAIHLYAGDFRAVESRRSLWSTGDHQRTPFSFPALMKGSIAAMKSSGNQKGLDVITSVFPKAKALLAEA